MTEAGHARVKALFLAALDRPAPDRSAFLAEATSHDSTLRAQVEALLAYHDDDTDPSVSNPPDAPRFQPGEVFAGRYRMVVCLGVGGMGEVWRAEDLVLGEPVAVKLLHAADGLPRTSLLNEARLARQVTHPSVCRVFDIGESGGDVYLSMELVQGEDLAALLRRVGRLPLDTALSLAAQMCAGLAAAHARGILHRDLKPANILIDEQGRVRVTDFGVAVAQGAQPAAWAGTPGYMAPEQEVLGGPIGPACDVWAAGVVLFEVLTGSRPSDSPDWTRLPSDTPPQLRDLLERCLVANPTERLADVETLRASLEAIRHAPSEGVADRSIVVLPFVNLSADPENEYFSDGLTEDVIADLSRIESMRVISRATAMRFKGGPRDLASLRQALNVRYALDGSVRKAGDRIRITVQLADAQHDRTLWSDHYTGTLDDIFDMQERVARAIADALRLRLTADDDRRLSSRPTSTGVTYDLFLRARRDILSFDPARIERARVDLEAARAHNDADVLVNAGLGMAYWQLVNAGVSADTTLLARAEACAQRTMALDPAGAHGPRLLAHLAAARGSIHDWLRYGSRAVAAAPRDPDALVWLAMGWTWAGRPECARPLFSRLEAVDPHDDYLHFGLAFLEQTEGRFAVALTHIRRARVLEPGMVAWPMSEIQILLQLERRQDAWDLMGTALPARGAHPLADMTRALVLATGGDPDGARQLLTPEVTAKLWPDLQYAYFVAQVFAALGDSDDACRWLRQSARRGFLHHAYLSTRDPLLVSLRGHSAFQEVMDDVRQEWLTIGQSP